MSRLPWHACMAIVAACASEPPHPAVPVTVEVQSSSPWLSAAARGCVRLTSCLDATHSPFRDAGTCVDNMIHRGKAGASGLLACLDAASTCEQTRMCLLGGGDARAGSFCTQRSGVAPAACDGDRFVSCGSDGEEGSVRDCAALGAVCRESRSSTTLRGCFSQQACPQRAAQARCEGSSVVACREGFVERIACGSGEHCVEIRDDAGEPAAACRADTRTCSVPGRVCDGEYLVACGRGGEAHVVDCSELGLHCGGAGARTGCYASSSPVTNPSLNRLCDRAMLPQCREGDVVVCAAGRLETVACASLGLGPCDPRARSAIATCSAPTIEFRDRGT